MHNIVMADRISRNVPELSCLFAHYNDVRSDMYGLSHAWRCCQPVETNDIGSSEASVSERTRGAKSLVEIGWQHHQARDNVFLTIRWQSCHKLDIGESLKLETAMILSNSVRIITYSAIHDASLQISSRHNAWQQPSWAIEQIGRSAYHMFPARRCRKVYQRPKSTTTPISLKIHFIHHYLQVSNAPHSPKINPLPNRLPMPLAVPNIRILLKWHALTTILQTNTSERA